MMLAHEPIARDLINDILGLVPTHQTNGYWLDRAGFEATSAAAIFGWEGGRWKATTINPPKCSYFVNVYVSPKL